MKLEPNLDVAKAVAGQPRPVDGVLAFLDVLLAARDLSPRAPALVPIRTFDPQPETELFRGWALFSPLEPPI